jgi:hypothetical protein
MAGRESIACRYRDENNKNEANDFIHKENLKLQFLNENFSVEMKKRAEASTPPVVNLNLKPAYWMPSPRKAAGV